MIGEIRLRGCRNPTVQSANEPAVGGTARTIPDDTGVAGPDEGR